MNTLVDPNENDLGIKYPKNRRPNKPQRTPVTITSFTIIGEEGNMIIGEAVVHVGGVAGYDVTFVGPLRAIKSTEPAPEKGPILVTFPNLDNIQE